MTPDFEEKRTKLWFDPATAGRLVAVTNAAGQVQATVYDPLDRITNSTDANGVTIASTYDALNRLRSRTYPDTGTEYFGYTTNVAAATNYANQLNLTNFYAYDAAGRKTAETNANGQVTQFQYDASGNLTALTDGNNHTTSWNYDQYGRLTNKVDALGTTNFTYQYDANNRLTNRTTPSAWTAYAYDNVGNLLSINYQHSPAITFQYDALNRVTNMVDASGTTVYTYDGLGQVLSEARPWFSDNVSYTYSNRLRTSLAVIWTPNHRPWTVFYAYDAARRLSSLSIWNSPIGPTSYTYDPVCKLKVGTLSMENGGWIVWKAYDGVARLAGTELCGSQVGICDRHDYFYNLAGQRTQQVFIAGNYINYTYDNSGQLKSATGFESGGSRSRLMEQYGYAYDPAGNLNWRTNNTLFEHFSLNAANELSTSVPSGTLTVAGGTTPLATNVAINGATAQLYADKTFALGGFTLTNGDNTFAAVAKDASGRQASTGVSVNLPANVSYTYDANGNLTSDGNRCFAYDDENQLVAVWVTNAWQSVFVYDGKMRRRWRFEATWNGSQWVTNSVTQYVHDGNLVVQERDGDNAPLLTYLRGLDLSGSLDGAGGIGGLLGRIDCTGAPPGYSGVGPSAWYHCDGNGNITCMGDDGYQVAARYLYDPFGRLLAQSGYLSDANLYRFSSKEAHANSGLYYYGYRFYDPNLQRWPNRDPIGELSGPNLYGFVHNAPSDLVDHNGLDVCIGIAVRAPNPITLSYAGGVALGIGLCMLFPETMTTPGKWIGQAITATVLFYTCNYTCWVEQNGTKKRVPKSISNQSDCPKYITGPGVSCTLDSKTPQKPAQK